MQGPTTGIPGLDELIGNLRVGDNVVWQAGRETWAWREGGLPIDTKAQETAREPGVSCPECGLPWSDHVAAL